ncbi:heme exporter protein CcmD [Brevundimonas sp.]|uniref:heme exporter protein CcmD n=1 Tax=Brevundimonas sp. TaxID=1871086 RepID=UPI0035B438E3
MTPLDLEMGAYAAFVWPAWGVSLAGLAFITIRALLAARRWSRMLKDEEAKS